VPWTTQELAAILALSCFRAVPFVGYASLSSQLTVWSKLAVLGTFAGLVALITTVSPALSPSIIALPGAYGYLALLALALPALARKVSGGWLARLPLCVILLGAYVAVPGALAPGELKFALLVLGWDSVLKAFSYCVDHGSQLLPPPRRELLFFMLVSPTLVLAERGLRYGPPQPDRRGITRCALGIASFLVDDLLRFAALTLATGPTGHVAALMCAGIGYYLSHSGLASLQIGFMRLIGYQIPERYDYPLLAKNPLEFWRRWNIWVGSWARRYLFVPLSVKIRRRWRRLPLLLRQAAAVLLTFGIVGALHDVLRFAERLRGSGEGMVSLAASAMFVMFGAMLMVWVVGVRLAVAARLGARSSRVLSHLLFLPCLVAMFWLAEPTLSGRGLPAPLPSLLWR
jgi:hypothetical protein